MAKLKFKNPPISELIIGVYFERDIPNFRVEHVGLFWASVRAAFPVVRQQPIVSPPAGGRPQPMIFEITNEQVPTPRFWFEAADGITLFQVQPNAFLFNWRKRGEKYPHFEDIKERFDKYLDAFATFVRKEIPSELPQIRAAELTYMNTFLESEYWTGQEDVSKILPRFQLLGEPGAGASIDFNQAMSEKFSENLSLNITVRSARSTRDPKKPALTLELRALGVLSEADKHKVDEWFNRAHMTIGERFLAITNPEIQKKYWDPE